MHPEEAIWIFQQIVDLERKGKAVAPILNLGSSTAIFREEVQPHIHSRLFAPLTKLSMQIVHCDIKEDKGVDICGDILDDKFLARISSLKFNSVICSNLLEHVSDPREFALRALKTIRVGGYVFVTCPQLYPYHPDPIDTMFRPGPATLSSLFPGTEVIDSREITLKRVKSKRPFDLILSSARLLLPFYKYHSWKCRLLGYRQSCVSLLKRNEQ